MPELPEVQTIVNDLIAAGIVGQSVKKARVYWPRSIALMSSRTFCRRIAGKQICTISRRGKFIVFEMSAKWYLLVHLRMSGRFDLMAPAEKRDKHQHVILDLDGGRQLRFKDTRKFGRFYLTQDAGQIIGHLGPEPLAKNFTVRMFHQCFEGKNRMLKPLLLDQSFIAGLGNIYVDEALWEACIHPERRSASLGAEEVQALHGAIRKVLKQGLQNLGTTLGSGQGNFYSIARRQGRNRAQLMVFRRTDTPCLRCGTPIQRIIVAQRSTHICPQCQH